VIIVIMVDPANGHVSLASEPQDAVMVRMALQAVSEELDKKFNNGQPPPRQSGLLLPSNAPAPPPPLPPTL
jgi:hypothetical protein